MQLISKYVTHWLMSLILCLLLAACATQSRYNTTAQPAYPESVSYYLQQADASEGEQQNSARLNAAGRLLHDKQTARAAQIIKQLATQALNSTQGDHLNLLRAELALTKNRPKGARRYLAQIHDSTALSHSQQLRYHELLASAYKRNGQALNSIKQRMKLQHLLQDAKQQASNRQRLWQAISVLPATSLHLLQLESDDDELRGWASLATINQRYQQQPRALLQQLANWRKHYPNHPGEEMLAGGDADKASMPDTQQIALLLPLSGKLATPGKAVRDGIMAAHFAARKQQTTPLNIRVYDSNKADDIGSLYQQAISDGANFVIGPLSKERVARLAKQSIRVPTLALNYSQTSSSRHDAFYEFGISPLDEAALVAKKASQDGYHNALVIAPKSEWGQRVAATFKQNWQNSGGKIVDSLSYDSKQNINLAIKQLLRVNDSNNRRRTLQRVLGKKLKFVARRRQDADMVFLLANPQVARQILPLLKYYYAGKLPVYATSLIYSGTPQKRRDRDLNGVIFCDIPSLISKQASRLPRSRYKRLYALGEDAYQLAFQIPRLAMYPQLKLKAATGALSLHSGHIIQRDLPWAQFKHGVPQQLS